MLKLGSVLEKWRPSEGPMRAVDPIVLLAAGWSEIAGAGVAANSHPAKIEGDTLFITTRAGGWSEQLSYLHDQVLANVNARLPGARIARLRFRVGRIVERGTRPGLARAAAGRWGPPTPPPPAATAAEALDQFREAVETVERAKRARGWKECLGCTVLIAPAAGPYCVSCAIARDEVRERLLSRLLFEAPWLGYAGTAKLIEDLNRDEYERIRQRLLARWWERLWRARLAGKLSRDGSERSIAASYVLLKSELAPERVNPATVRNVLGDEVYALIYGMAEQKNDVQ
jgi:hypothetical protein